MKVTGEPIRPLNTRLTITINPTTCMLCKHPVEPGRLLRVLNEDDGFCNCTLSYKMGVRTTFDCGWCNKPASLPAKWFGDSGPYCSQRCQREYADHERRATADDTMILIRADRSAKITKIVRKLIHRARWLSKFIRLELWDGYPTTIEWRKK